MTRVRHKPAPTEPALESRPAGPWRPTDAAVAALARLLIGVAMRETAAAARTSGKRENTDKWDE